MVDKGLNLVAVSTAHGHTSGVGEATKILSQEFNQFSIMVSVTSREGEISGRCRGTNNKVGQGPGSICTTNSCRCESQNECPLCRFRKSESKMYLNCCGWRINRDIVKALTQADAVTAVVLAVAGSTRRIIEIEGKYYKQYRGMGSLEAMRWISRPLRTFG